MPQYRKGHHKYTPTKTHPGPRTGSHTTTDQTLVDLTTTRSGAIFLIYFSHNVMPT
jgi:hypothetical protein